MGQNADALAIPVRKDGDETPSAAAQATSAEKAAVQRLTSKLRNPNASPETPSATTEKQSSPARAETSSAKPASSDSSPVIESRLSLYNIDASEIPTGLLRKRTSGSAPAPSRDTAERLTESTKNRSSSRPKENGAKRTDEPSKPTRTASNNRDNDSTSKVESKRATARSDRSSDNGSIKTSSNTDNSNKSRSRDERESSRETAADEHSERDRSPETARVENEADMAALDNLRPTINSTENISSAPTPLPSAGLNQSMMVSSQIPPTLPTSSQSQPAAMPAPVAQTAPNLYLPQATPAPRSGSIWSRLFGRNNHQTARVQPTVIDFNSDYATRESDDVCPVVLPGYGINGRDIPIGHEDVYRLTSSLPDHYRPTDLTRLPTQYCHYGNALYLRREAANSLCQMIGAAAQQGLTIRAVSAFRDYDHQMRLYTQAVARGGEDQKSVARPGRSEHYLGTTVDLTNDEEHCLKRSFGDTPEGRWLAANAASYGWKLTVMSSNARRSHNDEPWHLRYLGSTINNPPSAISPIAQRNSQPQRRSVLGKIGSLFGLGR